MSAKTDHPQNFAYVVGVACSHFEVLERLIRQELRIVSDTGEDELSWLHAIGALAQSFIFHVSRAYRMCEHQREVLSKDPDKRKAFLRYIESRGLVEVRDVNEHGFDPP